MALQKAVDASADFPGKDEARQRLALLAIQAGGSEFARTELENYLQQRPNDPVALARLAPIKKAGRSSRPGGKDVRKSSGRESALCTRHASTGLLYGQRSTDDPKAYELVTKARQAYPDDPEIAKTLGILNYRRGYYAQSVELLKAAAGTGKDDAELLYYLGEDYNQLKQWNECKDALKKALAMNLSSKLKNDAERALTNCSDLTKSSGAGSQTPARLNNKSRLRKPAGQSPGDLSLACSDRHLRARSSLSALKLYFLISLTAPVGLILRNLVAALWRSRYRFSVSGVLPHPSFDRSCHRQPRHQRFVARMAGRLALALAKSFARSSHIVLSAYLFGHRYRGGSGRVH